MSKKGDLGADHREEEEEEEEEDLINHIVGGASSDTQDMERERMKLLLANFDEDQMARYEAFRRANINRNAVKKLANAILNQSISANVSVALSGMSKVLVGDIVERARDVQARYENIEGVEPGPLRPEYLRVAWREYKRDTGSVPGFRWSRVGDMDRLF
ncbi:Transcription initiation factor TFIID subunit 11 [Wickerhamiella sorbophila]|uniref:Transcription initiation factor TFIID subunit 11 n=1 Tax=Wickerhamiella sorbophila TaxID=45607 RepID=A0A2T0FER5_9ASCO|nr:Transcription initiation factor TFIID subunit 11 [Wickerhamiella sorbophila]PRT53492.1 Transcription initiation factor TFIID subunit 11 [Wickerhamiella sorbophila]